MNVLSLFSGIGGLELGLERAGMTVVGQVEIDPFCRRVLAKHWPEVPRHDDVRTAAAWWRSEPRPAVHVVAGGFPCQPVSNAGKRRGEDDDRWLWPAFLAVVRDLRPRYAVMENVAALLGRGAGTVLGDLAACGYDAEWDCIPAAAVGAPHRRDRWFAVAYPGAQARRRVGAGRGQQQPEGGRPAGDVADTDGAAGGSSTRRTVGGVGGASVCGGSPEPGRRGSAMANADSDGWPQQPRVPAQAGRHGGPDADGSRARVYRCGPEASGNHWATEPDVDRVAHGVPARVDRLRSLGNAVVPQVAEHIGRLIVAAHLVGAA